MTTSHVKPPLAGAKDTAVVLGTTGASLVFGIGIQSCLAWLLLPEGRGSYAVCVAFAGILAALFTFGTERGIQYYMISGRLSKSEAVSLVLTMMLLGSALSVFAGWALMQWAQMQTDDSYLKAYFDKASASSFYIALAFVPMLALNKALEFLLIAQRRFVFRGFAVLTAIAIQLLMTVVFVRAIALGTNGALLALLCGGAVTMLLQLAALCRGSKERIRLPKMRSYGPVISFGLRYYLARLGNIINGQIGLVILTLFASKGEIGLFAAATALISRVLILPDSLNKALQPRLGEADGGRPELVAQLTRILLVIMALAVGAVAALAGLVVPILLSPAFEPCVILIWIMAVGVWLQGASKPLMPYFIAINRPGIASLATGVRLVTNVTVLLVLFGGADGIGLPAAAWAFLASNLVAAFALAVAFRLISGQTIRQTWLPRRADVHLLTGLLGAALGRLPRAAARRS